MHTTMGFMWFTLILYRVCQSHVHPLCACLHAHELHVAFVFVFVLCWFALLWLFGCLFVCLFVVVVAAVAVVVVVVASVVCAGVGGAVICFQMSGIVKKFV